jgi:hypothetical protein
MDPRYQFIVPILQPRNRADHERNWDELSRRFNSLPYGSGVFEQGSLSNDPKYYPNRVAANAWHNVYVQPDLVTSSNAPIKLVDVRNSPFTQVLDNYLVVDRGGWWEFVWSLQHISGSSGRYGSYISYEANIGWGGPGFPLNIQQFGRDIGQQGYYFGGDWPIHNQTALKFLPANSRVRLQGYTENGNVQHKLIKLTARLVLSE